MKRLVVPIAVLVLAGCGWAWEGHSRGVRERSLARVATELAGRPVGVHCQSLWADLLSIRTHPGEVRADASGRVADAMELTRETCRSLGGLVDGRFAGVACLTAVDWSRVDWAPDGCVVRVQAAAHAVGTLAHEAMHLRGWLDEATAQCYAVQTTALAALLLGADRPVAEALAAYERAVTSRMPGEYQSSECRPGGRLDLHPETPAFPTEATPEPPSGYGPSLG